MKKITSFLLAGLLLISLCACSNAGSAVSSDMDAAVTTTASADTVTTTTNSTAATTTTKATSKGYTTQPAQNLPLATKAPVQTVAPAGKPTTAACRKG